MQTSLKQWGKSLAIVVLTGMSSGLLASCSTSPTGRSQLQFFSHDQLAKMGNSSYEEMKKEEPIVNDADIIQYVSCVSHTLIKQLPEPYSTADWEITVFDKPVVNAFALPGANIGVYNGLLHVAKTPAQLAAVIGHEIGHVIADHSNERMSSNMLVGLGLQIGGAVANAKMDNSNAGLLMAALGVGAQVGILLPYSRTHESEADELGLGYMAKAGFDPHQAVELWKNMAAEGGAAPPELLSTHPSPESRIDALQQQLPEVMPAYQTALKGSGAPQCQRPERLNQPLPTATEKEQE
ncbi:peptidase [Idiomarina tyrosinivorans]|uniref:Peptidase n=1 Tax=Idiomarina tyrosinivorans TaxID=1445662 RepID=A0A432ZRE0_9GAMM|nr:M48 family metallopeptidase [Idiomarina tyrosinivorans]RUO80422.1 peptidase [Idiomarina tyrosinivorans]